MRYDQVEERVASAKNTFLFLFPGPSVRQHNEQQASTVPMFYECAISYTSDKSTIQLTSNSTSSLMVKLESGQVDAFDIAMGKELGKESDFIIFLSTAIYRTGNTHSITTSSSI